jgi:predicted dehydrogenase
MCCDRSGVGVALSENRHRPDRGATVTVGIGIIGAGGISRFHARHLQATPDARLVAIVDVVPERAQEVAAAFRIPHVESSLASLVSRSDIDGVVVCTPNDSHAPASIAAAQAGKHVLCEKPLALTAAEAREMVRVAEAEAIVNMVHFSKRPMPGIVRLKALIDDGELGDILYVSGFYLQSWVIAPSLSGDGNRFVWRLDRRAAGSGVLGDLASHVIDLVEHLCGPIALVAGTVETKVRGGGVVGAVAGQAEVDDHTTTTARLASGATAVLVSSRIAAGTRDELTLGIYGTRGAARFDNSRPERLEVCLGEVALKYTLWSDMLCPLPVDYPPSLDAAFVQAIRTARPVAPSFADGLRVQVVMEAIERAADQGGWVDVASGVRSA